jgi:hypothetical protein
LGAVDVERFAGDEAGIVATSLRQRSRRAQTSALALLPHDIGRAE